MDAIFNFPESAKFGKTISKEKIYRAAKPNAKARSYFVSDVEKIIWSYKLSPETTNLPCKRYPKEIQVLTILLKSSRIKDEVLMTIDKAIPSPIIFVLRYNHRIFYTVAYKRVNEADKNKQVISCYFRSNQLSESANTISLPSALDLSKLYEELIYKIISLPLRKNENIKSFIKRAELLKHKELELEKICKKQLKEKQFNRKVDINSKRKELRKDIKTLRGI